MIHSPRGRLARALGRHLVRIMPHTRADWAAAMQAEIEAIDDPGTALGFAVGCVQAGYGRRLRTVPGVLAVIRWGLATATMLFAALIMANCHAAATQGSPPSLTLVFAVLGLAFLAAGLTLARNGPGGLAVVAAVMLALNTVALSITGQTVIVHTEFHRAIVIEGYLLWTTLLLAGLALHGAARSARLAALARARGWDG